MPPSLSKTFRFAKLWVIAFVSLVGLTSGLAQLLPISITTLRSIVILGSCGLAAVGFVIYRVRRTYLPVEAMEPCIPTPGDEFLLCCPCDEQLSRGANELANRHYAGDNVSFDHYELWRQKNRSILVCLITSSREVVAYFDVLPFKATFIDTFLTGRTIENQIRPSDILPPQHASRCRRLYLGGVAVKDPDTFAGRRHASILVWGLMKYIEHYYPPSSERQLFALAATKEGEHLLRRFGFRISSSASERRDGYNLYVIDLAQDKLQSTLAGIPDWGNVCRLSWNANERAPARQSGKVANLGA